MAGSAGTSLTITLPDWLDGVVAANTTAFDTDEARMRLAIALSRANVVHGGSPFGAVVFAGATPVACGVNRVLDSGFSIAHAEIVALTHAQHVLAKNPEAARGPLTLVTSAEPCCQCFGAIVWSGVSYLICGAMTPDVEAIGFDEGPKPTAWPETLRARGISVLEGIARAEACDVLAEYKRRGGPIYGSAKV